jgi:trigger factor
MGMIKSMYGKSVLAEEINRLASNGLYDYLKEQNIDIIAQPLPSETIESDIDIEKGETFVFAFDLGLAPIFDFNISNKDTLDKYVIAVDESEVDKEVENLGKRYGKLETVEVSEEKDVIYATATELNESNTSFEGGVNDKEISFTADLITDEAVKKQMTGVQAGTVLNLNIYSLFNENHTVIASTLGIAKEAVADLNPTFKISITEIKRQIPAEINQELFDQVMGEGVVTDIDTFRSKIKENLESYYKNESDQQIEHMISHLLEEKHEVPLPDAFLKRWLLNTKEEQYSADNIDERYENESKVLKEILIREKAAAQYELKVEQQDIEDASLGYTLSLFRNYGMQNPDFEFVKKFSDDSLKKRDYIEQMNDIAIRRKVYNQVKEIISYNEKPVSIEEFYKLIETHNLEHQH